nr:RE35072p [Drosophila melanogaster]
MEGLEEIIVTRQIPTLHILMSLDELPDTIDGLQKPNTSTDFWDGGGAQQQPHPRSQPRHQQQPHKPGAGRGGRPNKRTRPGRNKPGQQPEKPAAEENLPAS